MFKWYYYHFVKFLNISELEKWLLALASKASDLWIDMLIVKVSEFYSDPETKVKILDIP